MAGIAELKVKVSPIPRMEKHRLFKKRAGRARTSSSFTASAGMIPVRRASKDDVQKSL
jgi:hypothetical protein